MFLFAANAAAQGTTPRLNPPSSNPPIANSYPALRRVVTPSSTQLVPDTSVFQPSVCRDAARADAYVLDAIASRRAECRSPTPFPTSAGSLPSFLINNVRIFLVEGPANLVGQILDTRRSDLPASSQGNSPEASHRVLFFTYQSGRVDSSDANRPKPGPRDGTANGPAWLAFVRPHSPNNLLRIPSSSQSTAIGTSRGSIDAGSESTAFPNSMAFNRVATRSRCHHPSRAECGTRPTRRDHQTIGRGQYG